MAGTNTLAYFASAPMTKKKGYMMLAQVHADQSSGETVWLFWEGSGKFWDHPNDGPGPGVNAS